MRSNKYRKWGAYWDKLRYYLYTNITFLSSLILLTTFTIIAFSYNDIIYKPQFKEHLRIYFYLASFFILFYIWIVYSWQIKMISPITLFFNIFRKISHYSQFSLSISLFYSCLIIGLTFEFSMIFLDDKTKLNELMSGSYLIALFISLVIGIYSLIYTKIISNQQRLEIIGFESFLENIIEDFKIILEKVNKYENNYHINNNKVFEIVIVDFQPFIGSKSLGVDNLFLKEYINTLEKITTNQLINLTMICHTEELISKSFNLEETIKGNHLIKNISINDAIKELSKEGHNVNLWRANFIGPYHFIIIDDIAYEYLVIPYDIFSNKNILSGTKHIDQSKVHTIKQTYKDIISFSIKPKDNLDLSLNKTLDFNNFVENIQENIIGVKIRFQFEEKPDHNRNSIINYKKGNYPIQIKSEKSQESINYYLNDSYFKISNEIAATTTKNKIFVTHNVTSKIAAYKNILGVASLTNHTYLDKELDFACINGNTILKEEILSFDDINVYLENRHIERKIIDDRTFLKIKLINSNGFETEYSYKSKIKLW